MINVNEAMKKVCEVSRDFISASAVTYAWGHAGERGLCRVMLNLENGKFEVDYLDESVYWNRPGLERSDTHIIVGTLNPESLDTSKGITCAIDEALSNHYPRRCYSDVYADFVRIYGVDASLRDEWYKNL